MELSSGTLAQWTLCKLFLEKNNKKYKINEMKLTIIIILKNANDSPIEVGDKSGLANVTFFLHAARVWTPHMHNFFFQQLAECDSTQNKTAMYDKGYCCFLDDEDGPSLFRPLNET